MRSRDNEQPPPADQLVHPPAPVVRFATDAAAQSVTGPLKQRYDDAAAFAFAEWQQADQCDADIAGCQREIADLKRRIVELEETIQRRSLDRQQHLTHAQQGVDVANPSADLLGYTGVQVPQVIRPLPMPPPVSGPSSLGELDERSQQALGAFLDEHAAIGQDGTR
ncbi:hypothetical protein [Streptosporangium sp. NPDC051022]|uniref:hypothetical protein n=1 Tax=Streptosporangium sp. NPDC051022 TaxID=3155752 RepID=UPI003430F31C